METFSLMPKPGDAERLRERRERVRVWMVEFPVAVERLFCTTAQVSAVRLVDMGVPDAGLLGGRSLTQRPTDRDGVWLMEFGAPLDSVAVDHANMPGWMSVLRSNGMHGRYRECGTDTWYEF